MEDVRLEAAAARFVEDAELRDFEAPLLDAPPFAALRLPERAAVFEPERELDEREALALPERDALDFAALFEPLRAAVERDEAEREDDGFLAADLVVDLAAVFFADERDAVDFAAVFFAPDFAVDLLEDFVADLLVDFAAVFVPAFFEAVLFEPDFEALFAAPERDEEPVDFAALLRAVEVPDFLAPDFLAPDLAEDVEPPVFLALDELRRALLFFAPDFLVLVAPVSPVNSIVSGLDLSSVGIAASFKGLRVQPSRLQGNVVIPSGFRLTESVESRTRTISVDTLCRPPARTCGSGAQYGARQMTRRHVACSAKHVFSMSCVG